MKLTEDERLYVTRLLDFGNKVITEGMTLEEIKSRRTDSSVGLRLRPFLLHSLMRATRARATGATHELLDDPLVVEMIDVAAV